MEAHEARHDAQIVEHFRTALILLSQHYREGIVRHCQGLLRCDLALAEEFARHTFLEVPRRMDEFEGKELRFILFRIATELCEAHRKAIRFGEWITDEALGRLSRHDQAVLFLRDVQGFSFREIGEILGIDKPNTVLRQYQRARRRLEAAKEVAEEDGRTENVQRNPAGNPSLFRGAE